MEVLGKQIDVEGLSKSRFHAQQKDKELAKKITRLITSLALCLRDKYGVDSRNINIKTDNELYVITDLPSGMKIISKAERKRKKVLGLLNTGTDKFKHQNILFECVETNKFECVETNKTRFHDIHNIFVNHDRIDELSAAVGEMIKYLEQMRTGFETQSYLDDLL
jgi:hypothetical protein